MVQSVEGLPRKDEDLEFIVPEATKMSNGHGGPLAIPLLRDYHKLTV